MTILLRLFLFGFCFFCHLSVAQSRLNPESHNHGMASMTVLYEAGQLLIELETPAANMLGFEHAPQNTKQWEQFSLLEKTLNTPEKVIAIKPDCKIQSIKVELPFEQEREAKKTAHPPSSDHHGHSHDDHKHNETHQDIHLYYQWQCNGLMPPEIQLHLFKRYPNFETIHAQWIANGNQGSIKLDKKNILLRITP